MTRTVVCPNCQGLGQVVLSDYVQVNDWQTQPIIVQEPCPLCEGRGSYRSTLALWETRGFVFPED